MTLQPVDRLEIQVLVDNVTDSLSRAPSFVTREWNMLRRNGLKRSSGPALCCANHGLALVLTLHRGGTRHAFLFDGGPDPYAIERNGPKLGVAFGAIEAAISLFALRDQVLPPTINHDEPDPAITLDVVPNTARAAKVTHVLSNSFGFGGQNVCLVISGEPA
jgi:hypothetical protein